MRRTTSAMTTLHPSSRKQLMLQLLNKRHRAQHPISRGFTLIELLVVIVILGVLGAVGYSAYVNQIGRANAAQAQNTATALAKACAAAIVTGDQGTFDTAEVVQTDQAQVTGSGSGVGNCALDTAFTVTVDPAGAFERESTATVNPNGSVTPGELDDGES